ncbi:hypothetical protein ACF0H5_019888 [Mactra antiquata]
MNTLCKFRSFSSMNISSRSIQGLSVLNPPIGANCADKPYGIRKAVHQIFYPTHQVLVRNFGTSNAIWRSDANDSEEFKKPRPVLSESCPFYTTLFYSIKLSYYILFFDKDIKWHVGPSFAEGIKMAFIYVTDCLADRNYKGLENVVAPELYEKIVEKDEINHHEMITKIKYIKMTDIDWQLNQFTKEKDIKVTAQIYYSVSENEVQTIRDFRLAYFYLHRRYGDNMKDSNWTVYGLRYIALPKTK